MAEIIAFASGKGGTGKSTAAANIGAALAKLGGRVLLMDLSMGSPSLDAYLGVTEKTPYNLIDIFENNCTVGQALIQVPSQDRLFLITASPVRDAEDVDPAKFRRLVRVLEKNFDWIVLDLPAGYQAPFACAKEAAGQMIFVAAQDTLSCVSAKRLAERLGPGLRAHASLILNRVRTDLVRLGEMPSPEDLAKETGLPVIGLIPEDVEILLADEAGAHCINLPTKGCASFTRIARRIRGEDVKLKLSIKG